MGMGKGYFVTGTDTGVGKTLVAGGLAALFKDNGLDVGVMKPVATGCNWENNRLVSDDALFLKSSAQTDDDYELINPVSLEQPLAPSAAARLSNTEIDPECIRSAYRTLCGRHERLIVEGIGGLLVPISDDYFVADMAREMELPLIIVCRAALGTINHTLMTVAYAQGHGLKIKGIIVNDSTGTVDAAVLETSIDEIGYFTGLPLLGMIPCIKGLDAKHPDRAFLAKIFRDKLDKGIII